jgi:hypothetical protein
MKMTSALPTRLWTADMVSDVFAVVAKTREKPIVGANSCSFETPFAEFASPGL